MAGSRFNKGVVDLSEGLIHCKDLSKYGKEFQIKFLALLIKDRIFSGSILPIVQDDYFSDIYLRKIFACVKEYIKKYPSSTATTDNLKIQIQEKGEKLPLFETLLSSIDNVSFEDRDFVIDNARRFCFSKHALIEQEKIKLLLEEGKFEEAQRISIESFKYSGLSNRKMYDLKEDYEKIFQDDILHRPVPLPFEIFNKASKGGPGSGNLVISVAFSNFGKCFQAGTKIRMYDLSLKEVQDIVVGDKLLGPDGLSRTVTSLATGQEEMFEIQQSNGINYTVNKSHILCLKRKKHFIIDYKTDKEFIKHKDLEKNKEYINITVADYLEKSKGWRDELSGYKAPQYFEEKKLKLDPYFLGLWLGDGSHSKSVIYNIDKEVISYLETYAKTLNVNFKSDCLLPNGSFLNHSFLPKTKHKRNLVHKLLRFYNLLLNKHIPKEYLFSSRQQRLELLAGLIDSDGYLEKVTKTCFDVVQKRKELAWQIYILSSSLGFKTKFYEGEYNKVTITGDTYLIPTKIPRKQAVKRKKQYDTTLSSIKIESKGIGTYYGFTLSENDPDRKFLLEDFTVVHNTASLTAYARHANSLGKNVAFFSFEIGGVDIIRRYIAGCVGLKQEELKFHKEKVRGAMIQSSLGNLRLIEERATNATVEQIRADLEYLKSTGFFPDMICVDSLNQLKLRGRRTNSDNEKFEILAEELRDLANDYGIPVHSVFQSNRQGATQELNDIMTIGKAIEPFQVADMLWTFSQTNEMAAQGKCLAWLLKNRLGPKNLIIELLYDPNMGTFKELGEVPHLLLLNDKEKKQVQEMTSNLKEKLKSGLFDKKR